MADFSSFELGGGLAPCKVGGEKERKDTQKAMLYDLRLIIKGSEKEQYTKDKLLDLLDTIAAAKNQE